MTMHPALSVMINDHLHQNFIILCQALWMDLEGGEVLVKTQTAHQDLKDLPCSIYLGFALTIYEPDLRTSRVSLTLSISERL